jgi:hypothetical protein
MSEIKDGGPAFPRNILDHGHGVTTTHESGMTLRDYFAAKAMQAFLTGATNLNPDPMMYADAAYDMADAMLKARGQE